MSNDEASKRCGAAALRDATLCSPSRQVTTCLPKRQLTCGSQTARSYHGSLVTDMPHLQPPGEPHCVNIEALGLYACGTKVMVK